MGAYDRPLWRGRTNVDAWTIAAIEYAEELAGHEFVITQGSYNSSVSQSGGTHDGGGVVDIRWTGDVGDVRALRMAGFAAWHRTPAQGDWVDHVHAVLVGHGRLSAAAAAQVDDYRAGRNGLASHGPDDGPRLDPIPVYRWPEGVADMPLTPADLDKVRQIVKEELAPVAKRVDQVGNNSYRRDERLRTVLKKQGVDVDKILAELEAD